jgi:hypothetical protein
MVAFVADTNYFEPSEKQRKLQRNDPIVLKKLSDEV